MRDRRLFYVTPHGAVDEAAVGYQGEEVTLQRRQLAAGQTGSGA